MTSSENDSERQFSTLYRRVWFWHFFAGLITGPVLLVVATTGALYVFKDELERIFYWDLMFVEPASAQIAFDELAKTAETALPGSRAVHLEIYGNPERAVAVLTRSEHGPMRRFFLNQHSGELLGEFDERSFFPVVLEIHRNLFAGNLGRVLIELTTGWTVLLALSGIYLWWPRRKFQLYGVLLPRLSKGGYRRWRDLHAVFGAWSVPVALVIAITGLMYSLVWGTGFQIAAVSSGAFDLFFNPPKNQSEAGTPRIALDDAVRIAREAYPGASFSIDLPHDNSSPYVAVAGGQIGPSTQGAIVIDSGDGRVLLEQSLQEMPALAQWASWNYPLHVGSVLGMPTKIMWFATACVLSLMPITGAYLWWIRRPKGQSGFPKRSSATLPVWLVGTIAFSCMLLPLCGVSMLIVYMVERALSIGWFRS